MVFQDNPKLRYSSIAAVVTQVVLTSPKLDL